MDEFNQMLIIIPKEDKKKRERERKIDNKMKK